MSLKSRVHKLESRSRSHACHPILLRLGEGEVSKFIHPAVFGWCPAPSGQAVLLERLPCESFEEFLERATEWIKGEPLLICSATVPGSPTPRGKE